MVTFVELFAQLDVILIAIMLSGTIVQMGKHKGKVFWDKHFKSFYFLFAFFIFENIIITVIADYVFLPIFDSMLPYNFFKVLSLTITLTLACCIWFIHAFDFNLDNHLIEIGALLIATIATLLLFIYT
jgi:hypothetical protein